MNEEKTRSERIAHNTNVLRKMAEGCPRGGYHANDAPADDGGFICMKCGQMEWEQHEKLDWSDPELQFWYPEDAEDDKPPF